MMGGKDGNSKWHDNGAILPVKHPSKLGKEKSVLELEMLTSNIERDMMHGSKACPPFFLQLPTQWVFNQFGNSKWHDNGAILPVKHPSKLGKEKSVLELEMLYIIIYSIEYRANVSFMELMISASFKSHLPTFGFIMSVMYHVFSTACNDCRSVLEYSVLV